MKKIYFFSAAFTLVLFAFTACKIADGKGNDLDRNAVFMNNANAAGTVQVMASEDGFNQVVMPRLAEPASSDVKVKVSVDKDAVEAFNKANHLKLMPIEPEDIVLTNSDGEEGKGEIVATIKKGELLTRVAVNMPTLDPEKYPFSAKLAVALVIKEASDDIPVLSTLKSTIITLNRKIKTSVMHVEAPTADGYSIHIHPHKDYEELTEWTFQFILQANDIHGNNQTTGSLRGSSGFYNRINKSSGFQCKSEGRDGTDTWTNKPINEGEWIHVSYVYRDAGLAGKVSFYINGKLHHTFTTSPLEVEKEGWGFGNSNLSNYYLREVRFWNRALTEAEILDKYYLPEPADSPGLEACFPFTRETYDEANGTFLDICGNWRIDMKGRVRFNIVDNVVFPATSLTIEGTPGE